MAAPTLEELAQYVRKTLPQPKLIQNLLVKDKLDAVSFHWQGKDFIVKPSLQVLEMRGSNLFITGASMLIQSALMKRDKNEKIIETVMEILLQVQDLISSKQQVTNGLKLLESVKGTLKRLSSHTA